MWGVRKERNLGGNLILAFNLNAAMKRLVLGGTWIHRGLKAIRFHPPTRHHREALWCGDPLIHIAGRILIGGRRLKIRIGRSLETLEVLIRARERMQLLARPSRA